MNISYYNSHLEEEAKFTELYDFAEEYGLEDLRPSNIQKLWENIALDESLAVKFQSLRVSKGIYGDSCNEACRKILFCELLYDGQPRYCKESWGGMDYLHTVFGMFIGKWVEKVNK